jgi:hypothetical protein
MTTGLPYLEAFEIFEGVGKIGVFGVRTLVEEGRLDGTVWEDEGTTTCFFDCGMYDFGVIGRVTCVFCFFFLGGLVTGSTVGLEYDWTEEEEDCDGDSDTD